MERYHARMISKKMLRCIDTNPTSLQLSQVTATKSPYSPYVTEPTTHKFARFKLVISNTLYCRYNLLAARFFYNSRPGLHHESLILTTTFDLGDEDSTRRCVTGKRQVLLIAIVETVEIRNIVINTQYAPLNK